MLKIQSIQASLAQLDESKIPCIIDVNECLTSAGNSFRAVLRAIPKDTN